MTSLLPPTDACNFRTLPNRQITVHGQDLGLLSDNLQVLSKLCAAAVVKLYGYTLADKSYFDEYGFGQRLVAHFGDSGVSDRLSYMIDDNYHLNLSLMPALLLFHQGLSYL